MDEMNVDAFQKDNVGFFNKDYIEKVKTAFYDGEQKLRYKQLDSLEDNYLGKKHVGVFESEIKGEVFSDVISVFDKAFMNKIYFSSVDGDVEFTRELVGRYKNFKSDFRGGKSKGLKKIVDTFNDGVSSERKKLLGSFVNLSNYVFGNDVNEINESLQDINVYLMEDVNEGIAVDKFNIMGKRINNFAIKHKEKIEEVKGQCYEVFSSANKHIHNILDTLDDFEFKVPFEMEQSFVGGFTNDYNGVQKSKASPEVKEEVKKTYTETFERLTGKTVEDYFGIQC